MKLIYAAVALVVLATVSSGDPTISSVHDVKNASMEQNEVVQKWQKFEERIHEIANSAMKMLIPKLMEAQNYLNLSSSCVKETMVLVSGVKKIKTWAIRFMDSSAKMIDGVLTGTMSSFGAYDQCITTMVPDERPRHRGKVLFQGKYCSLDVKPPLPPKRDFYKLDEVLDELKDFSKRGTAISEASKFAHFFYFISIRLGLCVPSGCSINDVEQLGKLLGGYLYLDTSVNRCEMKEENDFSPVVIAMICAFSFLGLLMLIGSLMDLYCRYTERIYRNVAARSLLAFSLITNFQKFVDTKTSSDTLSCLNGIRFLCMTWVVLGHTYLNINFQLFRGLESVRTFARDFAFQAVINASVAVDTFFCMGGLLVCYLTVKLVIQGNKPFNVKLYIFHRLFRILPVYAYAIAFMFLANLIGSGPIWHDTTHKFIQACHDNWWTNLLFINNFYNADNMCIPQSWYIASDMQLYIASLIVIIPLIRWRKVGLGIAGFGIIASMVYSGVGTYLNNYPPTMLFAHPDPNQRNDYWANFYFKPFAHAGPYCIGLIAGYILATRPKLHISKPILVMGWCAAIATNMAVLYGVLEWNRGRDPTFWETLFYSSCNRVAWTLGVAWMIVCCATGHGGVVNYILSWKAFIPLGRLTFVVYLIHPIVQIAAIGNVKAQVQPQHFFAVWVYFGHLCVTYGAAFAGSMLVEAPFLGLEKIIVPRKDTKPTQPHVNLAGGSLKVSKSGDLAAVLPEETSSEGSDNKGFVCKL